MEFNAEKCTMGAGNHNYGSLRYIFQCQYFPGDHGKINFLKLKFKINNLKVVNEE